MPPADMHHASRVDDQRSSFTAPAEEGRISHSSLGDLHGESGQRAIDTGETRAN